MDKNLLQTAKAPMIALINPQAPKGRHDLNHGCNPWTETTPANHGCNPCAVTHRAKTLLLLLLLAMTTAAQAQTAFGGGSGSETNPYIIATTEHLDQLAANVNGGTPYTGMYFRLTADLDYEGKTFTPIGRYLNGFQGYFNGFHHSINNVTVVSEGDCIGIFGFLNGDAQVRNLTLGGNSRMEGPGSVGGIVGYMRCHANLTDCSVSYCHVGADVIIAAHDKPNSDIADFGGIVGTAEGNFTIRNCTSRATLTNSGIGRCTGMGGIVGTTVIEGTIQNCISLSPINCGNDVGGIIGRVFSGTPVVVDNLYTNFLGGGIQGTDTDGAAHMGRISFGDGFATTLVVDAAYTDGSTNYGKDGSTVTLQLAGNIPGYATFNYFANGTALTPNDGGQYTFTMPVHTDVTVTLVADKRDIGYSDWVSISIPPQIYTGSSLTPVVTVTDNMSGTPIVLVENTDYTVTLPDGGCIVPGNHTITITGIGDFGGQTTAEFAILNPGSGTEDDPFVILNTEQMDALAASVNGGDDKSGLYFRLEADLDYSGKTYTPVGTNGNRFQGHFDGIGHSISNVVINQPSQSYLGLFGCVGTGGTVTNLVLGSGSAITGNAQVGGIVGYTDAGVTLSGCSVNEGVTITGDSNVGGIAGCIQGNLNWCVNKATVSGSGSGSVRVGGIAGLCYQATLTDNMNLGAVSGSDYVGGICGVNAGSSTLSNNYYAGNCTAGGINGGDVAGQAMRGYVVSAADGIFVQQMPDDDFNFTGITYDGIIYLGAGQTGYFIVGRIDGSAGNFAPSAGTLTAVSSAVFPENYYSLAMPTEGQDVVISSTDIALFVSGYGTSTNAGWRFIASPVAGSIEAEAVGNIFFPNHDLYRFNQSAKKEWENYKQEGEHYHFAIENGKGYLYAAETDITLFFSGPYNEAETQDVPLVYDGCASFAGWNLVGNPFPVAATIGGRDFYRMNPEGSEIIVAEDPNIAPMEGIFVHTDTDGETVTFSRATRTTGNGGRIVINLSRNGTLADRAIVRTGEGRMLPKFQIKDNSDKLYIPQNGQDCAIAYAEKQGEIPLNFKATQNGEYTLNVNIDNAELNYLHLIDNLTGADIDLLSPSLRAQRSNLWGQGDYTFTATPADYASRFRLVFSANDEADGDAPFAYIDASGNIIITGDAGTASLQIVDVMGRVIRTVRLQQCDSPTTTTGMTPGVYVLRLINGENVRTQKIVVE